MKTSLLILILVSIFTTSYSKKNFALKSNSDSSVSQGITAIIDGVSFNFNIRDTAILSTTITSKAIFYNLVIGGQTEKYTDFKHNGGNGHTISITVGRKNKKIIANNTYYSYDSTTLENGRSSIGYIDFPNNAVYGCKRNIGSASISKVVITSIDSASVKGTFLGELMILQGDSSLVKRVTINGAFNVPLIKEYFDKTLR
jgi:hypothetical protein